MHQTFKRTALATCIGILSTGMLASPSFANDGQWRALDPANTLLIETSKGRMVIEMRPEMAPKAVERIKLLTREKTYDGLQFHRVIAKFVAQTGNPNNKDGGGTSYPNLPPEMVFRLPYQGFSQFAQNSSDASAGFIGSVPFQALPVTEATQKSNGALRSWGAHCTGVAGMGRNEPRDSANSELYFMLDASRRLDRDYTVFGRVVIGLDVLLSIQHGEPPASPDMMKQARILSDIPEKERPQVLVASDATMRQLIDQTRQKKGADFSVCDVEIPAKLVNPK
ncbi:peptidylprolyl isomerase [Undibacterium sp. LX40W]|uniref:peptidylprolyl isomerase n=1 Tax=Undibacterium nitidum TaxID=2762298 RepID=A0A923HMS5_9BURK|nr:MULTISPECIES: peptidylprolyl isomerase [Undibacterium]MBC3881233.1 peptidylprolyl isomerase [Undibacterium nitidum]MBC3890034.1 peptidylprolyl isomerase [Undibacterium sp. LX40W]